jgi:hypothetical protein
VKWITWENVGVDRMACAWLISRFIDPEAEFEFIAYGQRSDDPRAFDIPGARLSHHNGRCTFAAILAEYAVADPVLERMARILDEADTVQEVSLEPAAAGLDLVCRGIRLTSRDDHQAIATARLIYEGLYAALAKDMT